MGKKNKNLLVSKRIPYHIKTKIYNTYVLPVVLYGLECVNWTTKRCGTVEIFQNHIMRFMTNHSLLDHIPIKELRKTTKLIPITSIIKSKVLKLYGHIKRSQSGFSKIALEGMVEGRRSRERQHKCCRDLWKKISHVSDSEP